MKGKRLGIIIMLLAAAAFALSACGKDGSSGSTGATGAAGPAGPAGPSGSVVTNINAQSTETLERETFTGAVTSVSITSPPVVNFWVKDSLGYGVVGLGALASGSTTNLNYLRFAIAKLVPGTSGSPDQWVSYMVNATTRPTSERLAAKLVDHGDGTYTYTFDKNITDPTVTGGVTYEPTLTHRITIQFSGSIPGSSPSIAIANSLNVIHDFVPAGGAVTAKREITTTAACNDCHTKIGVSTPHGGRVQTGYCVVCHTDQRKIGRTNVASTGGAFPAITYDAAGNISSASTYLADGVVAGDFVPMIHKIHMGNKLTKTNYNYAGVLFNHIGYPQDQSNCRKCHTASTAAPQGDNWKNKPSRVACGACHDGVDFTTGANHGAGGIGGAWNNDSVCNVCHFPDNIELKHMTVNATPNNPSVPTGAGNFTYEISSVTVNASNQPVVTFRILKDGTPVTFNAYAGTTPAEAWTYVARGLLTSFAGSASFLVAYAIDQDGITAANMIDYNNRGKSAAQPASVSIAELATGAAGTLVPGATAGTYVATINNTVTRSSTTGAVTATSTATFPAGANLRAIALQGYFTQTNLTAYPYTPSVLGGASASGGLARHTIGVVKGVASDRQRRTVVNDENCAKCHEWFEGHGGNRVKTVALCVTCHVPNLSSSGRTVNLAHPEAAQNQKDMIHGIHAANLRTNPYTHARAKSGSSTIYDWSHVTYPAVLNRCETCHNSGTYGSVPDNSLMTTNVTTTDATASINAATSVVTSADTTTTVTAARNTVPNATDLVISPFTAACVFCHDSSAAKAHMTANGGSINARRSTVVAGAEQCVICHGSGRSADVAVVHK